MPAEDHGSENIPAKQASTTPPLSVGDTVAEPVEVVETDSGEQMLLLREKRHAGPLPSPEVLRGYEDVLPGTAEAIVSAFKSETPHRHELEKKTVESHIQRDRAEERYGARGQWMGFTIALLGIGGGVLIFLIHPNIAGALGGAGVTGLTLMTIVTAFIYGRKKSEDPPSAASSDSESE